MTDPVQKPEQLFYVRDTRTNCGNACFWWGKDSKGYTTHIDRAGKYTMAQVLAMRETDVPYPVEEIDKIWSHHVDYQHLRDLRPMKGGE